MIRNPHDPLGAPISATVYLVGALRVTLDDESGRPLAVASISPEGCALDHFRLAYVTQCITAAQRKHRLTLEG